MDPLKYVRREAVPQALRGGGDSNVPFEALPAHEQIKRGFNILGLPVGGANELLNYPALLASFCIHPELDAQCSADDKVSETPDVASSPGTISAQIQLEATTTKEPTESRSLRETGNEHYAKVTAHIPLEDAIFYLHKAIALYKHALSAATTTEEIASALKNQAMASFKVCRAMCDMCKPIEEIYGYMQKALYFFSRALRVGKDKKWIEGVRKELGKFTFFALYMIRERTEGIRSVFYLYDFTVELKYQKSLSVIYIVIGTEMVEAGYTCLNPLSIDMYPKIQLIASWALENARRYATGRDLLTELTRALEVRYAGMVQLTNNIFRKQSNMDKKIERIEAMEDICGMDDERFLRFIYETYPPVNENYTLPTMPSPWDSSTSKAALERAVEHYDYMQCMYKSQEETVAYRVLFRFIHNRIEGRLVDNYEII